jgi:hypothetical protein
MRSFRRRAKTQQYKHPRKLQSCHKSCGDSAQNAELPQKARKPSCISNRESCNLATSLVVIMHKMRDASEKYTTSSKTCDKTYRNCGGATGLKKVGEAEEKGDCKSCVFTYCQIVLK